MSRKSKQLQASSGKNHLTLQQHETDSPYLPVADLEKLYQFKPDAIDWFLNHTDSEAKHRRGEVSRLNSLVIISTYLGQIFALILGLTGIIAGTYIAITVNPLAGVGVSVVTLITIAIGLIHRIKK